MISETPPPSGRRRVRLPVRLPLAEGRRLLAWCARHKVSPPAELRAWIAGDLRLLVKRPPADWPLDSPLLPAVRRPYAKIWLTIGVAESIRLGWYAACRGASKSRVVRTWITRELARKEREERAEDLAPESAA